MRGRSKVLALLLLVVLGLSVVPVRALAQDRPDEVRALEGRIRDVVADSIPKTVCIRVSVNPESLPFGQGGGGEGERMGFGSGAIISADGLVLTCSHVVDIATRIEVIRATGEVLEARLLGLNRRQDYALLDVEGEGLPHFDLGSSAGVAEGDWVVALGHPGGPYSDLQPAASLGRVTGLHRHLPVQMLDRYYDDAIQTDVPIFAGNSGGPLVDLDGHLIGLNGAILLINENSYTVPIDEIAADLDRMRAGEEIAGVPPGPDAWLELQRNFSPEDFQRLMERMMGRFGEGDWLSRAMEQLGEQMGNPELGRQLGQLLQDPQIQEMVRRFAESFLGGEGGDPDDLMRQFGEMFGGGGGEPQPPAPPGRPPRPQPGQQPQRPQPGPVVMRGYLGVEAEEVGGAVRVRAVAPGSPAALAGLQAGDWVLSLDGAEVTDVRGFRSAIEARTPGTSVAVDIARDVDYGSFLVRERSQVAVTLGRGQ